MAPMVSFLLYLAIAIFPFGQLLRLQFAGLTFPAFDMVIGLLATFNFFYGLKHKKIYFSHPFSIFLIFTLLSLLFNTVFGLPISFRAFFYYFRLLALLSLFIIPPPVSSTHFSFFKLALLSTVFFGLAQYLIWPDFTSFQTLGWDPHLNRIVGTFLDPTFTGLIFLFFFIFLFLELPKNFILLALTYAGLSLTYSRATLLSLFAVSVFVAFHKKTPNIALFCALLLILTVFALPRPAGEGSKLERSSTIRAKIINYQEGLNIFFQSPIIGHGYNRLSSVRIISNPSSHANSGFDGSILTLLCTTGIAGTFVFVKGIRKTFNSSSLTVQA
ncbi:MAG: O-antigen ligase family protein, partial [Candidatus Shapirobacteria bacterium]